jgi:hypothetical protein
MVRSLASMTKNPGQSLSEYGLIGGLVALCACTALVLMGNRLSGLFGAMIQKPNPQAPVAIVAVPPAPLPAPEPALPAAPGSGGVSVQLSDGSSMKLSLPSDIAQSVQTVGANGTTDLLASSLETMAGQMLADGKIDQNQANVIQQLANEAHHLANIQKTLEEDTTRNGKDTAAFKTTPVTVDGTTYANAYEAALSIGYNDAHQRGAELQRFWDLYTQVTSKTYMWPPELKEVLQYHATAVNDLSDSMRVAMRNMIKYHAITPAEINDQIADTLTKTHKQSASICTMQAGNRDTGVHCSS